MKKNMLFILMVFWCYSLQAGELVLNKNQTVSLSFTASNDSMQQSNMFQVFDAAKTSEILGLKNINEVKLDAIFFRASGNAIEFNNLRILSDSTSLNDYLSVNLMINAETFQLIPTSVEVVEDIGIYYHQENLFVRDVQNDIDFITPNGEHFGSQTQITINSAKKDDEFILKLEKGMLLSFNVFSISDDMTLKMISPDGSSGGELSFKKNVDRVLYNAPIFESDEYKWHFIPHNNETVSCSLIIANDNSNSTVNVSNGSTPGGSLDRYGMEYDKYILSLKNGDYLNIRGLTSDVKRFLINSNSVGIANGNGNIFTKISYTDNYYLIIQKESFDVDVTYNFSIEISHDKNLDKYPVLTKIENQTANKNESFSLQLNTKSKDPIQYQTSGLPTGLNINSNSGKISGSPEIAGVFPIRVFVANEYGSDQDDFLLSIQGENIVFSDTDKDGVIDSIDMCKNTPLNSCVNNKGCSCELVLLEKTDYVSKDSWRYLSLSVEKKYTSLDIKLFNLEQDLDLYVRKGQKPSHDKFDCRPFKGGIRAESCNLINEGDNIWYLGVHGYMEGNFTIKATAKSN